MRHLVEVCIQMLQIVAASVSGNASGIGGKLYEFSEVAEQRGDQKAFYWIGDMQATVALTDPNGVHYSAVIQGMQVWLPPV